MLWYILAVVMIVIILLRFYIRYKRWINSGNVVYSNGRRFNSSHLMALLCLIILIQSIKTYISGDAAFLTFMNIFLWTAACIDQLVLAFTKNEITEKAVKTHLGYFSWEKINAYKYFDYKGLNQKDELVLYFRITRITFVIEHNQKDRLMAFIETKNLSNEE